MRNLLFWGLIALTAWATISLASAGFDLKLGNRKDSGFLTDALMAKPWVLVSLSAQFLAILCLYAAWFATIWRIAHRAQRAGHWSGRPETALVAGWASTCWLVLRGHNTLFPNSYWTWFLEPVFDPAASIAVDLLAVVVLSVLLFRAGATLLPRRGNATRRPADAHSKPGQWPVWKGLMALLILVVAANWFARPTAAGQPKLAPITAHASGTQGNVIVIGLDSLRRDTVRNARAEQMPTLAGLVESGFLNDNVVTPLARTFPSWVTILTGQHPLHSGARANHAPQQGIDRNASMAWAFKAAGYRTVHATDETRFSHIVPEFGFEQVVGPQMGVTDFLIGQFADQPLVNLAIQLPLAEYLLPALVGNRAFAHAYRPERFVSRLSHALGPADERPVFLAVHLCTAHWPFFTAEGKISSDTTANQASDRVAYGQMVRALDAQLAALLSALAKANYLEDDTLLVLLADHGEGLPSDASHPPEVISHGVESIIDPPIGGHGGSLLAPEQWAVFTLFHGAHRAGLVAPGVSSNLASLEDVAPKILDLMPPAGNASADAGQISMVLGSREHVFMETGWRPSGFNPLAPDGSKALRIAESSYDVLPDGRIEMKPHVYAAALSRKDLGVTNGDQSLIITQRGDIDVLVETDHAQHHWNVFNPTGPANRPMLQAPQLLDAACSHPEMRARLGLWCAD